MTGACHWRRSCGVDRFEIARPSGSTCRARQVGAISPLAFWAVAYPRDVLGSQAARTAMRWMCFFVVTVPINALTPVPPHLQANSP